MNEVYIKKGKKERQYYGKLNENIERVIENGIAKNEITDAISFSIPEKMEKTYQFENFNPTTGERQQVIIKVSMGDSKTTSRLDKLVKSANIVKLKTNLKKIIGGALITTAIVAGGIIMFQQGLEANRNYDQAQQQNVQEYIQRLDEIARSNGEIPLSESIEEANPNLGHRMIH